MAIDENTLPAGEWLDVLREEYLHSYVSDGGAAVKVVVADPSCLKDVRAQLAEMAVTAGYQYAHADAATRKLHLLHGLYNEIARQIPWGKVAHQFMTRAIMQDGRKLPDSVSLAIESLAEVNDEAQQLILQDLRRILSNRVFRDYTLSREFRSAMIALCRATYEHSEDVQEQAQQVRAWLEGGLDRLSILRTLGIYRKISRNNARQMLFSTANFLWSAGIRGLVVTFDFSRYALGKEATSDGNAYTKLAALDMNEVLRQFVDSTDEFARVLFIFMTSEAFLQSEDRGLNSYEALRLRLTDDVRDRRRPNPFAPMVRLECLP